MKYFFQALFLLLCPLLANAQIILNADDFFAQITGPNPSSYVATDTVGLQALISRSGPSQTWDFTGRNYTQVPMTGTMTVLSYPGGAALASDSDFKSATHVIKMVYPDPLSITEYEFIKANSTGLWILGVSRDSMGIQTKEFSLNPPWLRFKFPLTYQTAWHSSTSFSVRNFQNMSMSDSIDVIADAFGTLTTPPSVNTDALRLKTKTTMVFSIGSFTQKVTYYDFDWYTKTGVSASIHTDSNEQANGAFHQSGSANKISTPAVNMPNPASVRSQTLDNAFHVSLSQNPATSETMLYYTMQHEGAVSVSIVNTLGRSLQSSEIPHASAGENLLPINVQNLEAGTYFIRVITPQNVATQKLIIVK